MEFVGDRLRFKKISTEVEFVGREEIEEINSPTSEEFFKLIRKIAQRPKAKRSENPGIQQARIDLGRPPGRPVCMTCTSIARSTARLTVAKEWSTGTVDRLKGETLSWSRSTEDKGR